MGPSSFTIEKTNKGHPCSTGPHPEARSSRVLPTMWRPPARGSRPDNRAGRHSSSSVLYRGKAPVFARSGRARTRAVFSPGPRSRTRALGPHGDPSSRGTLRLQRPRAEADFLPRRGTCASAGVGDLQRSGCPRALIRTEAFFNGLRSGYSSDSA